MKNGVENLRGCANQLSEEKRCNLGSCNKLNVYNEYKDLPTCPSTTDIVEVRFKNTRKAFFRNVNKLKLIEGDMVAVEASPGHDIGIISLTGELVINQMLRKHTDFNSEFKKVYRKVKPLDIEKWDDAISREDDVMLHSRRIAKGLNLEMKIGDVEFQGDGTKAIFYYIADERVDFRELIKILADEFKIRIEMKQIGARQEAGRIGGIGSCGRELCCSAWMSDFVSVSTDSAREQEISLNPQKLAGQCGKLKCCLNYELKSYKDAKSHFPGKGNIETHEGTAYYMKSDIFKGMMWYSFDQNIPLKVTGITIDRVKELLAMNKAGKKPEKLKVEIDNGKTNSKEYIDLLGQESITRFDKNKQKPRKNKGFTQKKKGKYIKEKTATVNDKEVKSEKKTTNNQVSNKKKYQDKRKRKNKYNKNNYKQRGENSSEGNKSE